jgi:hypothetical protein
MYIVVSLLRGMMPSKSGDVYESVVAFSELPSCRSGTQALGATGSWCTGT